MITLDENGRPGRPSAFSQPRGKVAHAVMMARRLVDPIRIGPDTEIANVQHIVEANSKRCLEREHVLIETVHCSVNVARRTDKHRALPLIT
jgi:hypothetical protein